MATSLGFAVLVALAGIQAGAGSETKPSDPEFGLTIPAAVEVCDPQGEREYLARLVCPSGERPKFDRIGSAGGRNPWPDNLTEEQEDELATAVMAGTELKPGEIDYHTIDSYEVSCGEVKTTIYLDMYHCSSPAPQTPPSGFTIAK